MAPKWDRNDEISSKSSFVSGRNLQKIFSVISHRANFLWRMNFCRLFHVNFNFIVSRKKSRNPDVIRFKAAIQMKSIVSNCRRVFRSFFTREKDEKKMNWKRQSTAITALNFRQINLHFFVSLFIVFLCSQRVVGQQFGSNRRRCICRHKKIETFVAAQLWIDGRTGESIASSEVVERTVSTKSVQTKNRPKNKLSKERNFGRKHAHAIHPKRLKAIKRTSSDHLRWTYFIVSIHSSTDGQCKTKSCGKFNRKYQNHEIKSTTRTQTLTLADYWPLKSIENRLTRSLHVHSMKYLLLSINWLSECRRYQQQLRDKHKIAIENCQLKSVNGRCLLRSWPRRLKIKHIRTTCVHQNDNVWSILA